MNFIHPSKPPLLLLYHSFLADSLLMMVNQSRKKEDAVGKTSHAVEESYPAVGTIFHGIYFRRDGGGLKRGAT